MTTDSVAPESGSKTTFIDIPGTVCSACARPSPAAVTRPVEWRKQQLRAARAVDRGQRSPAIAAALEQDLGPQARLKPGWPTSPPPPVRPKDAAKKRRQVDAPAATSLLELSQLPGRGWIEYEPYGTVLIIGA